VGKLSPYSRAKWIYKGIFTLVFPDGGFLGANQRFKRLPSLSLFPDPELPGHTYNLSKRGLFPGRTSGMSQNHETLWTHHCNGSNGFQLSLFSLFGVLPAFYWLKVGWRRNSCVLPVQVISIWEPVLPPYDDNLAKKFQNSFSSPVQEKVTEQADTPYSVLCLIETDAKL